MAETLWWRRRIVVVAETPSRARQVLGRIRPLHRDPRLVTPTGVQGVQIAVSEVLRWSDARAVRGPLAAVLADIDDPRIPFATLSTWADRAWQPLTVLILPQALGATRLRTEAESLGFLHVFAAASEPPWESIGESLNRIVSGDSWMAVCFVRSLKIAWTEGGSLVASALLAEKLPDSPCAWAELAGMYIWQLEKVLADHGLVPPRKLLPRLRVWRALVEAKTARRRMTRDQLARVVGYRRGDYLGRCSKALTGVSFGDLVTLDITEAGRLVASGAARGAT